MSTVLVLMPNALPHSPMPDGTMLVPFHTAFDAVVALRASEVPAVLVTDGLDSEDLDSLAGAIRERGGPCIEVRFGSWDGETHSAVSAVCRGVISGFGRDGVVRAIEFLAAAP